MEIKTIKQFHFTKAESEALDKTAKILKELRLAGVSIYFVDKDDERYESVFQMLCENNISTYTE